MTRWLLRGCRLGGRGLDVRLRDGIVTEMAPHLSRSADEEERHAGGELLPGLSDHHIHLAALAADASSVRLGAVPGKGRAAMAAALVERHQALPAGDWLRATGYHPSVLGELDRVILDALVPDRPVRVQHRSGAMWVLNSAALRAVGVGTGVDGPDEGGDRGLDGGTRAPTAAERPHLPQGIERDGSGAPTGRLFGLDGWLRPRVPRSAPDLVGVARALNRFGVTAVSDMTATDDPADVELLATAVERGLTLRVTATGSAALPAGALRAPLRRGPVKVVLADHSLPTLDELRASVAVARRQGRNVAVHCVTRVALVLALAAWEEDGALPGDRIEHGAVVPPDLASTVAGLGVTVVTQPNFVAERGDAYLAEVEEADRDWLYPCASLLARGVPVALGTDAPFGHPDPWRAVRAATERLTPRGVELGGAEKVAADVALSMFLTEPARPGLFLGGPARPLRSAPRSVRPGAPADLCLLEAPLPDALNPPGADRVAATFFGGRLVYDRAGPAS